MSKLRGHGLSPREMAVLLLRYGLALDGSRAFRVMTLDEVGAQLGVSRERVRQLEAKAFRRLREEADLPDHDAWWRELVSQAVARIVAHPPRPLATSEWGTPIDDRVQRVIDARYPLEQSDGPVGAGTAE